MAENLSETVLENKMFYNPDGSTELGDETIDDTEGDLAVEEGEESTDDDNGGEEDAGSVEFNGRQITAETLEEWELAHKNRKHQQADYTKKTQAASEQMRLADQALAQSDKINTDLQVQVDAINALMDEEEKSIDWDDLEETDPGQAMKLKRKIDSKRKAAKAASKTISDAKKSVDDGKILEQARDLQNIIPDWFNANGTPSKVQESESKTITEYTKAMSYPADYFSKVLTAREFQSLNNASKYWLIEQKKLGIKNKQKKSTVIKKSASKVGKTGTQMDAADINKLFYG